MKKSKLFLVGMIAVLAASLVFLACENPAGPKGDKGDPGDAATNAQKEQLATYGFTFGNPVHNVVGRNATWAPTVTGAPLARFADTALDSPLALTVTGKIIVVYGRKQSVSFPVSASTTAAQFKTAFNFATGRGGFGGVTLDYVLVPGGGTTNKAIQISGLANELIIVGTGSSNEDVTILFGASNLQTVSAFEYGTAGLDRITTLPIKAALKDTWTVPLITSKLTHLTSTPVKLTLDNHEFLIPNQTDLTTIADTVQAELISDKVIDQWYKVTVLGITDYTGEGLIFTADKEGEKLTPSSAFIPAFSDFDLTYGYNFYTWHKSVGVITNAGSGTDTQTVFTLASATTNLNTDSITISYKDPSNPDSDTLTDTTVLPLKTGAAFATTDINTTLTNATLGATVTITAPAGGYGGTSVFNVTAFGGGATAALSTTTPGEAKTGVVTGKPDTWEIILVGGGDSTNLLPTRTSKVTFAITGSVLPGSYGPVYIPQGASMTDITGKVNTSLTGLLLNYSATETTPGRLITISNTTFTPGSTAFAANGNNGVAADVAAQ
ncbi:hypothetical protein FACS1894190_02670 [Spirochaetia bacterium]|nr:hypothetical protein FACS1894190_02670 [Spirochaetia bacterium]